jgi:tRNA pseudouridine38-40 synthase
MKLIESFYKAWNQKDLNHLNLLMSPDFKGARVFDETTFYKTSDFTRYINELDLSYEVKEIYHTNGVYYLQSVYNDNNLQVKIVTDGSKIIRYYEVIKQEITRYLCDVSYDGTSYHGFQKQQNQISIQSMIEDTIYQAFGKKVQIHGSGRTDKGVHAVHQMFHFDLDVKLPETKMMTVLNRLLPKDISINHIYKVPQTFHARYDVFQKSYLYKINRGAHSPFETNYTMHVENVDMEKFTQILQLCVGTHDFYSFTKNRDVSTIRTIHYIDVEENGDFINIIITGNGFLRYMVRYIIGAAIEIAQEKATYTITEALTTKNKELLKHLAKPNGLYLYHVKYQEDIDELSTFDL